MRTRLLASHIGVIIIAIVVLFVTVRATAPNFFDSHIGNMAMMGGPEGTMMTAEAGQLDDALARSVNEGFLLAAAVALPLGVVVSLLAARQLAGPVRSLAAASRGIAAGDYVQRVPVEGPPELEELARSFNLMAVALEGAERRRIELIGDVAHELRTPVTVLQGYVEALADGVFPASAETWSKLAAETSRLGRLAEELQDLSRAQAGQLAVSISAVSAGGAIRSAAGRLEPAFAEKGLRLDVLAPPGLPNVLADSERLVQVLSSLLSNALRYTPAPGAVSIAARRVGAAIEISVHDTGIGISAEHLPHIFERFYRVDRSRARSSGGTGVGLTIASALVTAMGGALRAESPGAGDGSTFTIVLPVAS
ncbi:MAG: HAMP domain-containing protein [Chloroflexi bacterium]|nr:HAMP domain-containing protein [Chloroflexota bacterium]